MNIEQEVRILNTASDLAQSMVNHQICCLPRGKSDPIKTVLPKDGIAKKYFFILLLEMIAGVNKELIPTKSDGDNLLLLLKKISSSPKLGHQMKLESLSTACERYLSWLSHDFEYEIYSNNIAEEVTLKMSRKDALYLVGNRCKHSLTRSNSLIKKLVGIYKDSGLNVTPEREVLLLEDIDMWLLDDFGGYHFTMLCDLTSNIHHAIGDYIRPISEQSLFEDNGISRYSVPSTLVGKDSIYEYCELLNRYRHSWMPVIDTWENLTELY